MRPERRHELKHDRIAEGLIGFAKRAGERRRELILIAIAVVAVIAMALSFYSRSNAQRRERWIALTAASDRLQLAMQSKTVATSGSLDDVIADLRDLHALYPDTRAGQMALLLAADAMLEQNQIEDAVKQYEVLLGAALPSPELRRRVLHSLAYASEQGGDYAAAAQQYAVAAQNQTGLPLAEDRWNEGRCLEQAGSKEEARRAYEAVASASKDTLYARLSRSRLDALLRSPSGHPTDQHREQPAETSSQPADASAAPTDKDPGATGAFKAPSSSSSQKEGKALITTTK